MERLALYIIIPATTPPPHTQQHQPLETTTPRQISPHIEGKRGNHTTIKRTIKCMPLGIPLNGPFPISPWGYCPHFPIGTADNRLPHAALFPVFPRHYPALSHCCPVICVCPIVSSIVHTHTLERSSGVCLFVCVYIQIIYSLCGWVFPGQFPGQFPLHTHPLSIRYAGAMERLSGGSVNVVLCSV